MTTASSTLEVLRAYRDGRASLFDVEQALLALEEGGFAAAFDAFASQAHVDARERGWHETPTTVGDQIALMHAELSEALEAFRVHGLDAYYRMDAAGGSKPEGVAAELADVIIRVADFSAAQKLPLGEKILEKLRYNRSRPWRHGGKRL